MKIKHITLGSIEDVNEQLFNIYNTGGQYIFRGEGSDAYTLLPSSLRPNNMVKIHNAIINEYKKEFTQVKSEFRLLQEFYVYAKNNGLDIPKYERFERSENPLDNRFWWEEEIEDYTVPYELESLIALAQHYGTYTRLLDFSKDVNVAIYFGIVGALERMKSLTPKQLYDIDGNFVVWVIDRKKLYQLNQQGFPIVIIENSYGSNENLKAQSGVFLYHKSKFFSPALMARFTKKNSSFQAPLTDRTPFDQVFEQFDSNLTDVMVKYIIPYKLVHKIYSQQYKNGNLAAKFFPGYLGVTKQIEDNRLYNWTDYYMRTKLPEESIFQKWTDNISMEDVDAQYGNYAY